MVNASPTRTAAQIAIFRFFLIASPYECWVLSTGCALNGPGGPLAFRASCWFPARDVHDAAALQKTMTWAMGKCAWGTTLPCHSSPALVSLMVRTPLVTGYEPVLTHWPRLVRSSMANEPAGVPEVVAES